MRFIPLVFLLLAGCSSYAQRVANTCSELGMGPGSPDYAGCVHDQIVTDQQDRAMWAGTTAVGASLLYRPSPVLIVAP